MYFYRKSGWLKAACLLGIWLLSLGATTGGSALPKLSEPKMAHGIHVDARFDASFHGVVEEVSFSDDAGF